MSTDLIVLFDVTTPGLTPESLREQLLTNPPELASVIERYRSRWRSQTWETGHCTYSGDPELLGPGGFAFRFGKPVLEVYHVLRFDGFAGDESLRTPLRRVWCLIAAMVGSSRAVYTHELMPWKGATLQEIERSLPGPPAATFEEMRGAELFGPRSWYVDDFSGLSTPWNAVASRIRRTVRRDPTRPFRDES
jgi:hypothetical protein